MLGLLAAGTIAFLTALGVTPLLIAFLRRRGIGQPIHDAVTQHAHKAGTPTMGGAMIPLGLVVGAGAGLIAIGERPTGTGALVVATVIGGAVVGAVDDWLKVRRGRNLGLRELQKTVMLVAVIGVFCVGYLSVAETCTRPALTRCSAMPVDFGTVGWILFAAVTFWLTTNSVNFSDGIEGLLAGHGTVTFTMLALIAFWQFRHPADYPQGSLELAILATALAAACCGFLWWNANPMTIFMGDTGSLAIGAGITALAFAMHVPLLIAVFGALYAVEGLSSFLQRIVFKLSRRLTGTPHRLFRMAPLHHHFEFSWRESTVVVRFWILNGCAAAIAGGLFYIDALQLQ